LLSSAIDRLASFTPSSIISAHQIQYNTTLNISISLLYLFGFTLIGIPIAYAMDYALAGFTTFAAILGRYNYYYPHRREMKEHICQ
jgi:hypothetical protein